jgi:(2R)-3-sulfolactate dehydrogenase (NADP+)
LVLPVLTLDAIDALAFEGLRQAGAADKPARSVARSIRRAEADGIRMVGLGYLPTYRMNLRAGKVDGNAEPLLDQTRGVVVKVDAANGFAHPAFDLALPDLKARARQAGMATLAIRRSYSAGVLGHWVEDLAEAGLVALAFCNSPPNIAPWGGRQALFGTNPMAFAAPRKHAPPLVIDQATSVVTKVALSERSRAGLPLEPGWALDADGNATIDGQRALAGGSLLPFGGAKGSNLALMIDLLAAGLTGATFSKDASPYAKPEGGPAGVGQLVIAFDPEAFASGFDLRIADLEDAMLKQRDVRLPGDRRLEARERIARDGIFVDDTLINSIRTPA